VHFSVFFRFPLTQDLRHRERNMSMMLRPKVCQNCHIAQVVAKIELGSGKETDVLWVCRSCTLELQKHDAALAAPAPMIDAKDKAPLTQTHQQGEYATDELEKLFIARLNRPINQKVNDLTEHYRALIAAEGVDAEGNKWNCIDIEFTFIEYVTGISLDNLKDCLLPINHPKNRYANVVAPDPTRVRLSGGPNTDYINANWVPGRVPNSEKRYIGAQGPLPNTVEDFWRMIYETGVSVIVMLTQVVEGDRVKCEVYWPEPDTPAIMYGQITVRLVAVNATPQITTRMFDLTHPAMNGAQRRVSHFQYTDWPDFGQPASCDAFLTMVDAVDRVNVNNAPLLVHCSAGIGRTGTFIVVHAVLEEYRYYHQKKLPLTFNLIEVLVRIRAARPGMVQTKDQLQFCYRALCEAIAQYNEKNGAPAKVRTVTVKPLPPSDRPPASVLAAASKIDIVPFSETEGAKRVLNAADSDSDSQSSSSDGGRDRRRRDAPQRSSSSRSSSSSKARSSSGSASRDRRRHGGGGGSGGGERRSGGRRSRNSSGSSAAASPQPSLSVLEQALLEAQKGQARKGESVFLDI
jgi:protein tyrosine phosphatase